MEVNGMITRMVGINAAYGLPPTQHCQDALGGQKDSIAGKHKDSTHTTLSSNAHPRGDGAHNAMSIQISASLLYHALRSVNTGRFRSPWRVKTPHMFFFAGGSLRGFIFFGMPKKTTPLAKAIVTRMPVIIAAFGLLPSSSLKMPPAAKGGSFAFGRPKARQPLLPRRTPLDARARKNQRTKKVVQKRRL
jgi:hypothetical protein